MKILFIFTILFITVSVFPQTLNRKLKKDFRRILAEQSIFINECQKKIKEKQIKDFGKLLPKIAGECEWSNNGCLISLAKSTYPETARRYKISGVIKVEIIIDESGKVVFVKAFKGNGFFYANAETAALDSRFHPLILCGRAVWQKRIIVYNFLPA